MRHVLLTDAERRVLRHLREGRSPKEIAARRHVSVTTVRTQLHRLYERTDARGLPALARWCEHHAECCIEIAAACLDD